MVRSFTLVLMAALTLLLAPEVRAGRRHEGRRCRKDAQCLSGTCCNGRCSPQSASCNEATGLAALVAVDRGSEPEAAPSSTGYAKPPPSEKCTGKGTFCGACGVCTKGRCTGGDTGRCGSCKTCSQDGSACLSVPDGSGSGPNGYYGCGPDAQGGLHCCTGSCVDTLSNIDNCGACGNACTGGKLCREIAIGVVGCACRDSETECDGTCANLQTDANNCGQCGHACSPGQGCDNGVCECLTYCDSSGNCGGGQAACGPCESCNNGACVPTCGGGHICCGDGCVDTQTDPNNCGGCGTVCPSGISCTNGTCDLCGEGFNTCSTGSCCRQDVAPTCCFGSRGGGGCCGPDRNCCLTTVGDGVCCPMGTHCCPNTLSTPCWPADQPCQ